VAKSEHFVHSLHSGEAVSEGLRPPVGTEVERRRQPRSLGSAAPVRRIWAARLLDGYRSPACEAMLQILEDVAEEFREGRRSSRCPDGPGAAGSASLERSLADAGTEVAGIRRPFIAA